MLQPFELFQPIYLDRLRSLKKRWLVSQSYHRASHVFHEKHQISILLTDYDTRGGANIHVNAVKSDKYAVVLDLENAAHVNKLKEMLQQDSPYKLYWAVVKSAAALKKRVDLKYKENMRRYIARNTRWRIEGSAALRPNIEVAFGELFIVLKYAGQVLRVKFEEIEKA
jgi:hypothetical protein